MMKKLLLFLTVALLLASCTHVEQIIPRAVNTVNTVSFKDLKLERKDYEVMNTISAEATVSFSIGSFGNVSTISEQGGEFSIVSRYQKAKKGRDAYWDITVTGVPKLGYLSNDYELQSVETRNMLLRHPEVVARQLAVYRIINLAKQQGADGVIEPLISTNVAGSGKTTVFQTTITAKMVKIKTDN